MCRVVSIVLFAIFSFTGICQKIDSIKVEKIYQQIAQSKQDSSIIRLYIELGKEYGKIKSDSNYVIANKLLKLSEKFDHKVGIGSAYHFLGNYYYDNSNYEEALKYLHKSYDFREEFISHRSAVNSSMMIGNIYNTKGDYEKAYEQYFRCLEVYESENDSSGMSMVYSNIGLVYQSRKQYEAAEEYYFKGLEMDTLMGSKKQAAIVLNNIGGLYELQEKYDTALFYFQKAMDIYIEIDYKGGLAHGYNNIGIIHYYKGNPEKCLAYFVKSLMIRESEGNNMDVSQSLNNIGVFHMYEENFDLAIEYSLRSLKIAKESGLREEISEANLNLYESYNNKTEYKKAVEYLLAYSQSKDSLYSEKSEKLIEEMSAKYDIEKKQKTLELKDIEIQQQNADLSAKVAEQKMFFVGIGALVLLIIFFIYWFVEKKKSHQNLEIQKHKIEEKNTEIMDSINYAKRIQNALLQSEQHVSDNFPPHFILFKPKDVVSGDFYWAAEKQGKLYLAVADCTGHGVPGAFMSMLGIAFLNEITAKDTALTPGDILDQLREKIIKELNQTGKIEDSKDGMDISMVQIDLKTKKMVWAGANNSLYFIRQSEFDLESEDKIVTGSNGFYEIKPNSQPIGFYDNMKPFTNHEIELTKGDMMYLFTDGYPDQFGGIKGKKLKYRVFKELLVKNSQEEIEMQKLLLSKFFQNWRGEMSQVDDVCVIGLKL